MRKGADRPWPPQPGEWVEQAACRKIPIEPRKRVRMFFPTRGDSTEVSDDIVRMCAACPVRLHCLAYALRYPVQGTWAGLSQKRRRQIRHDRREAS